MGEVNDRQHFVAWLDLLGFKEVLQQADAAPAVRLVRDKLPGVLLRAVPEKIHGSNGIEPGGARCEIEQFQDTIVLWTWNTKAEDLEGLLDVVHEILILMHSNNIPCRGGIAKGTLYTSRLDPFAPRMVNATLGQAVLRAYQVESKAEWAGIAIHESVHGDESLRVDVLEPRKPSGAVCRYQVPGLQEHRDSDGDHWVLGWPFVPSDLNFDAAFLKLWKERPTDPRAAAKHDNTRAFMKWWVETFKSDLVRLRSR